MRTIRRTVYDEVRSGMTGWIEQGIDALLPGAGEDEGFEEPYWDWTSCMK